MVQRSDDKGDKRSSGKSSETEARDAESSAANALRERIRQAGAAATARVSDHAPPSNGLMVPNSSAPPSAEHSGVRTRPPEPQRSTSITPPLFGPPRLTPGAMSVPWPAVPRRRELQQTRSGLGVPPPPSTPLVNPAEQPIGERPTLEVPVGQLNKLAGQATPAGLGWTAPRGERGENDDHHAQSSAPPAPLESGPAPRAGTPRGVAPPPMDTWSLSTARTQPMPRVRGEAIPPEGPDEHLDSEAEERRRAELATTRKTHGLLRAPDSAGSSAGRYSVRDVSTEYLDTGAPETAQSSVVDGGPSLDEPITEEVPAIDTAALEAGAQSGEGEPDATRPRRSTPKQRVGHRRSSRPEMGHARERGTKRTDPGIRARTLRGGSGSALAAKTAPQMPAARAGASAPLAASHPTPPLGSPLPATARPPGAGASGAITHRTAPLAAAPAPRPPQLPAATSGSIVVDPSLSQPNLPAPSNLPVVRRPAQSGYVPLPRDREAYEAFLRSAAGEHGGPPRARPSWAQQETALIPREALEAAYEADVERTIWPTARTRAVVGLVLIALSVGVGWWILEGQTAPPKVATPLPSAPSAPQSAESPSGARAITLIATEPTGAELLLDNAVIGNTPLEVARPAQGDAMYVIRLRGFEPQMVRITSTTREAIHITLVPAPETAPAPGLSGPTPAAKR